MHCALNSEKKFSAQASKKPCITLCFALQGGNWALISQCVNMYVSRYSVFVHELRKASFARCLGKLVTKTHGAIGMDIFSNMEIYGNPTFYNNKNICETIIPRFLRWNHTTVLYINYEGIKTIY